MTASGRTAVLGLGLAVLTLTAGCPLRTFEVDEAGPLGGTAGSSGGPSQSGGRPNFGGMQGHQGGNVSVTRPRTKDDRYVILQGEELRVPVERGLLANDTPVLLRVSNWVNADPARPEAFDGVLDVAEDGSFRFVPAARFFGSYRFSYTAANANQQTALGSVEVRVVPTDIDLDAIVDGIGGYFLQGAPASSLGASLDRAFDVNGDGLRDLVVGAPTSDDGAGAAYVVFGKGDLSPLELSPLTAASEETRFASLRAGPSDALGVSVSGAGDWDGDGTPDLVLGGNGGNGRAYVVSGSDVHAAVTLPAAKGYVLEGDSANVDVGRVVHGAGDVNGDGVPDVLVSASNLNYGWLHVLFGSVGLSGRATVTGAPGLHVRAAFSGDGFPFAATGVGDLDGDGTAEVLASTEASIVLLRGGIGYPPDLSSLTVDGARGGWLSRRTTTGAAEVASLGDVNGDGVSDLGYCEDTEFCRVVFGPPPTLNNGWVIGGFARGTHKVAIAGGGDIDGDKLGDVVLSDDRSAYVVYGRRSGFLDVDLNQLGADGYSLRAGSGGTFTALAILGDANGDGLADLALADSTADRGSGRVYVVFGVASR
ncbi:MAG TPA: hypothetical protein VG937_35790 [Polyangiaceae bacterium]|nr:hypothetical protein [Polyangiaceae bacterium]